jgi:hypothetical protein
MLEETPMPDEYGPKIISPPPLQGLGERRRFPLDRYDRKHLVQARITSR